MAENIVGDSVERAAAATEGQPTEVRAAAVAAAAAAAVPAPQLQDVGVLWKMLIGGLLVVLVGSLGGVVYLLADGNDATSPDVVATIFSSVLTGLVGLFARSPTQSS